MLVGVVDSLTLVTFLFNLKQFQLVYIYKHTIRN
jgi:hypothetical protein